MYHLLLASVGAEVNERWTKSQKKLCRFEWKDHFNQPFNSDAYYDITQCALHYDAKTLMILKDTIVSKGKERT